MRSFRIFLGVIALIAALGGVFAAYAGGTPGQKPDSSGLQSEAIGF
jgi:hypothetical protein